MIGLYARVSTDEQNVKQQLEILIKYVKSKNLKYRSYPDEGFSGTTTDRPKWSELLNDCLNKKINKIMVVRSDRITRDLSYALTFLNFIQENKIELVSLHDGINIKPFENAESISDLFTLVDNIFRFKLSCLLAEREIMLQSERRKIGIERAKKEGKYKGGKKGRTWKNN